MFKVLIKQGSNKIYAYQTPRAAFHLQLNMTVHLQECFIDSCLLLVNDCSKMVLVYHASTDLEPGAISKGNGWAFILRLSGFGGLLFLLVIE